MVLTLKYANKHFFPFTVSKIQKKIIQLLYEQMSQGATTPKMDKRGRHQNRANKISEADLDNVRMHIKSIPKYTNHYSRQKNPNKVYIDHDFSISAIYHGYYLEWCKDKDLQPVKESYYRKVFCTEFNIGFKLPKTDTCKTCDSLNIQIKDALSKKEPADRLNFQLELHHRRAEALQKSLKDEIENAKQTKDTLVISFDLEQALPVPSLTVGPAFYLRKPGTYNLGINDCIDDTGYMYMWSENFARRVVHTENSLYIHSDNCTGQNKNWSIVCLWQRLVKENIFESVEHRFLYIFYIPDDWYQAVLKAKRKNPFKVIILQRQDILCFKDVRLQITKKAETDDKQKLDFSKICALKFVRDCPNVIFLKHLWNEEFKSANIGKRGYDAPIPLNPKKISNLSAPLRYIPPVYQDYYRSGTKREYIEDGKTVADLHRDYVELCKDLNKPFVNYLMYFNIFKEEFNSYLVTLVKK
nr:unnamed protein product [Callosobruchus chinensis]